MLKEAIRTENLSLVKEILGRNPGEAKKADESGVPVLFYAALTGNLELMKYFVECSMASLDMRDLKGRDLLHYATMSGSLELCTYLVEKAGFRPDRGDSELITPFDVIHEMVLEAKKCNQKDKLSELECLEQYYARELGADYGQMYHNPVRSGFFPDPSVIRVGEDYYMVNSSFIFFPCIPISHSRDLVHWEIVGHAITRKEWSNLGHLEGGRGFWAPDISWDEASGRFYIVATYRNNDSEAVKRRQMVTWAQRPEGPYCEPVFLEVDGIDPSLFHEDGRHYMLLNRGARIFEISGDGREILSQPQLLYYGDQKQAPEGPHLLKKDGWYYLFLAEGGTGMGHHISVARSRTLHGRYEACPYNPVMRQKDPLGGLQRAGHGKPVCTQDGRWYMVYLCGRRLLGKYSILGRETALDPITWTADGWPVVNELRGPGVLQKKPFPERELEAELRCGAGPLEKLQWMTPREPDKEASFGTDGSISILESRHPLSSVQARNLLLRRQTAFSFEASVETENSDREGERGLVCYYDENTWVSFGMVSKAGKKGILLREHIGEENRNYQVVENLENSVGTVQLLVLTDGLKRKFQIRCGLLEKTVTLDNVYYLCDEGLDRGKRFTGALVGIYAVCGAGKNPEEVTFYHFRYEDNI